MITKYIIELLHGHDCVVLTDFGGFILNYHSAEIDSQQGIIKPPFKELAFNASLKNDDGLLCSYIVFRKNISYLEAKKTVETFVSELNNRLSLKENVYLEGLGNFALNEDDNVVFTPQPGLNFYSESIFMNNYLMKKLQIAGKSLPVIENKEEEQEAKIVRLDRRKWLRYAASVILVIGIGAVSYVGADYCFQNVYQAGFSFSDLHHKFTTLTNKHDTKLSETVNMTEVAAPVFSEQQTFADDENIVYDESNLDFPIAEELSDSSSVDPNPIVEQPSGIQTYTEADSGEVAETKAYTSAEIMNDEMTVKKESSVRYYIVVASYPGKYFGEAKRHALRLRNAGYNEAAIIYSQGRNRVIVCGSDNMSMALKKLSDIQVNVKETAWILEY
jgi:hypothetical protein